MSLRAVSGTTVMQTNPATGERANNSDGKEPNTFLKLSGLTKRFGTVTAVDSVDLAIRPGEFFALLGPSGCGKTTTMRCIAGFEEPSAGDILIEGESVLGRHPSQRNTGMVFQNYALFPHYDVFRNVAYGLIMDQLKGGQRLSGIRNLMSGRSARKNTDIRDRVEEALSQVQLTGYESRKITELSGGQQQRVALARALVKRPSLLLMDEPLSNLDAGLRNEMRTVIRDIQREVGITTVFVTHDQEEAMSMADRVALMRDGMIVQCAPPEELYERPVSSWAASFVGKSNLLQGTVLEKDSDSSPTMVKVKDQVLQTLDDLDLQPGETCTLMVRPEDIQIVAEPGLESAGDGRSNHFAATVERSTFFGGEVLYEAVTDLGELEIEQPFKGAGSLFEHGTRIGVEVPPSRVHILARTAERGAPDGDA